jgi:hypothetical protein
MTETRFTGRISSVASRKRHRLSHKASATIHSAMRIVQLHFDAIEKIRPELTIYIETVL